MNDMALIYTTFKTKDEAVSVLKSLMQRGIATCGNIAPPHIAMTAKGDEITEVEETSALFKTSANGKDALIEALRGLHSGKTPCIIDLGANVLDDYAGWLATSHTHLMSE